MTDWLCLYGYLTLAICKIALVTLKSENMVFVLSTLMYQSLYEDYCTTHRSCDFIVNLPVISLYLRCNGHLKIRK